ncbi:MAG: hypothetical protein ABI640_02195 [Gammaproteobacteria bacterium]
MKQRLKYFARSALWKVAPWKFATSEQDLAAFSIGIYSGPSPFDLCPAEQARNPVLRCEDLRDIPTTTVADPFMWRVDGLWHMFFEIKSRLSLNGEIAYATSQNGFDWRYQRVVLREPFHLSYPQVFRWRDDFFMIPETGRAKAVRIYRATRFPDRWSHVATLLEGSRFVDSSVFHFDGRWWMFTEAGPGPASPILRLFFASDLMGPWTEHPASPLVTGDGFIARPGGRVVMFRGRPVRFAQRVLPVYGTEVRAFEVLQLSTTRYEERQVGADPMLGPGNDSWNAGGMHHVDAHLLDDGTWLACVDGFSSPPRPAGEEAHAPDERVT